MYELVNFGLVLECNSEIEEKTKNDKKESNNSRISKDLEVSGEKTRDSTMRIVEKESSTMRIVEKESLLVGRYTDVLQDRLSAMEEETWTIT